MIEVLPGKSQVDCVPSSIYLSDIIQTDKRYFKFLFIHIICHLFESSFLLVKIFLSENISPMLEGLAHHRADPEVVEGGSSLDTFRDQVVFPPAFWTSTLGPPSHLSLIIFSPPSLVEAAIPLEPAIRILLVHPTTVLPLLQAGPTLHLVLVDRVVVH